MAAQADMPRPEPAPGGNSNRLSFLNWKRWTPFGKSSTAEGGPVQPLTGQDGAEAPPSPGLMRRVSRKVVPGLPRAKTFKRQQSEVREKLEAIKPTPAERRAVSVDRRLGRNASVNDTTQFPRASAPDFLDETYSTTTAGQTLSVPQRPIQEKPYLNISNVSTVNVDQNPEDVTHLLPKAPSITPSTAPSNVDARSIDTSQYDAMIHDELERKWILNLSMHFRDKSKREKFFITYQQKEFLWRRVTISLDYRNAPDDSLEKDLLETKFQREKSAKIYEAIRESLQDIDFYDTVTNLKLQTTDGRLHVHVVEDVNEIIHYPTLRMVQHLRCFRIRERDIEFDSHMSGFVYKVRVNGKTLIKKEIPGPDTVEEFLYEVNALSCLGFSRNVIEFYGIVVDDGDNVKGLLIDYADQGALIDVIYDSQEHGLDLPWRIRQKWAHQIVQGLSDIHEAGFVQGDFTLSNIVIDFQGNAKIIDINRRGCPVGWEPPEATPLIDSNQRISMYIGVKSDLYQLGMVLWALATLEDEPEAHRRPLRLDPEIEVPGWYRRMVENCLHENPRVRLQATALLAMFPDPVYDPYHSQMPPSISVDYGDSVQEYLVDGYGPKIRTVTPAHDVAYSGMGHHLSVDSSEYSDYWPPRGRSPPSPLPSHPEQCAFPHISRGPVWPHNNLRPLSVSDVGPDEARDTSSKDGMGITEELEETLRTIREGAQNQTVGVQVVGLHDSEPRNGVTAMGPIQQEPGVSVEDAKDLPASPGDFDGDPVGDDPTPTAIPAEPSSGLDRTGITDPVIKRGENGHAGFDLTSAPDPATHEKTDSELGPHYVHDSKEITFTRPTEARISSNEGQVANGSPREMPEELAGIGSAYGFQEESRQQVCSDEDLGLITTTTSAPQNVAT